MCPLNGEEWGLCLPAVVVSWILLQYRQLTDSGTQLVHVKPSSQTHRTFDVLVQFSTTFRLNSETQEEFGGFGLIESWL